MDIFMLIYWFNYVNISYDYIDIIMVNKYILLVLKKFKYVDLILLKWYMKEYIRIEFLCDMKKFIDFGDEKLLKEIEKIFFDLYFFLFMVDDFDLKDMFLIYVLMVGYDVLREDGLIYY